MARALTTYHACQQAPPVLIGIYNPGPQQQGRTTVAYALVEALKTHRYRNTAVRPFGEPIQIAAATFLECTLGLNDVAAARQVFETRDTKLPGHRFTGGNLLDWLASGAGRIRIHSDGWVRRMMVQAETDLADGCNVVCDDLMHPTEAEAMDRGGVLIRVERQRNEGESLEGFQPTWTFSNNRKVFDQRRQVGQWVQQLAR